MDRRVPTYDINRTGRLSGWALKALTNPQTPVAKKTTNNLVKNASEIVRC